MNYTSDFFLYKGDEGDFKYLKSEEDMNTPKDEMITEAIHSTPTMPASSWNLPVKTFRKKNADVNYRLIPCTVPL